MGLEELLSQGRIHAHRATRDEIARLLTLADRDIRQAIYDVAGLITEAEARALFDKAIEFVDLVKSRVGS